MTIREYIKGLLDQYKQNPAPFRELELTPTNWKKEFGSTLKLNTPVGIVKIGENQFEKLKTKKRESFFGLIKPTITTPDFVYLNAKNATVFVKAFIKADKTLWWVSITFEIDGLTVMVSSYQFRESNIIEEVAQGHLLFQMTALESANSDTPTQSPRSVGKSKSKGNKPVRKNANPGKVVMGSEKAEKAFKNFMHYGPDKVKEVHVPLEDGLAEIGTLSRADYFSDKQIFPTDKRKNERKLREFTHTFLKPPRLFMTADRKWLLIKMSVPATKRGIMQ